MRGLSWLGVEQISIPPAAFLMSHAHPDPKRPTPAALNFVLKSSKLPKVLLIASASLPVGTPPPLGPMMLQKKVWFQCPPPLLRIGAANCEMFLQMSSIDIFSAGVPAMALLRLVTYAW